MSKDVLVIGGGQSATSFVARLRQKDSDCKVTILGMESHLPYQRPPLSKKYAVGEMSAEQLQLRPADWFEANNVDCKTGVNVISIDKDGRTASTDTGESFAWDHLVLTTGSRPRRLPEAIGGNLPGVYTLRDVNDADKFADELTEGRKVVIVGGGYIGLEAAAVCASKGLNVTLVEAAERILQRVACPETSAWFRDLHMQKGVTIHEGVGLDRIDEENSRAARVVLANGEKIAADFVLVGIGIIPNAELASEAGLEVDGGIVTDSHCRTSHPDIYAAGDCAAFMYGGQLTRLESVQNAIDQAECAAENLIGEERFYTPYPCFWSDQFDVKLQIAGLNRGYDRIVVRSGDREGTRSHFYFSGDRLLAVDSMNDPRTYMVSKKMLEAGKNISPEQAADTDLVLKSLL